MASLTDWILTLDALKGLFTVLGGGASIRFFFKWMAARRLARSVSSFDLGFNVSVVLDQLRIKLKGTRACILVAHNGGGDLSVSRPMYTSVRWQHVERGTELVEWSNVPVQDGYWHVLQELESRDGEPFVIHVQELQEGSTLRTLYESSGIEHSYVFKLFNDPENFWYVSINRTIDEKADNEAQIGEWIRVARAKLVRFIRDKKLNS